MATVNTFEPIATPIHGPSRVKLMATGGDVAGPSKTTNQGGLGLVSTRFGATPVDHGAGTGLSANTPNRANIDGTTPPAGVHGGDGLLYDYTPGGQLYQTLETAIDSAVKGAGSSFSAQQLDDAINASLRQSGTFSPDQMAAIQAGELSAEPHGGGFKETNKGGGNTAGFEASWLSNITRALQDANPFAPPARTIGPGDIQPPTGPTPPAVDPGNTTTPTLVQDAGNTTEKNLADLLAANTGTPAAGGGAPPSSDPLANLPPSYQTVGGSSGGGSMGLILILLAAAGGGWYYMTHKHKHGSTP